MTTAMHQPPAIPIETVGQRLRRARVSANIKSGDMAKLLEVGRSQLSKWENDKEIPRRAIRLAYAQVCSVPAEWLDELVEVPVTLRYSARIRRHLGRHHRHAAGCGRMIKLKDVVR